MNNQNKIGTILSLLLLLHFVTTAQPVVRLSDTSVTIVKHTDSTYWVRVIVDNPVHAALSYSFKVQPNLNNTLYYYDANARGRLSVNAGIFAPSVGGGIDREAMTCIIRAESRDTVFIHVDERKLGSFIPTDTHKTSLIQPVVTMEKASIGQDRQQLIWVSWITSLTVLFLFFLNNLYVYFSFRDRTVGYFLVGQAGGLLFLTAYKQVLPHFFICPVFSLSEHRGMLLWFDLNSLLVHAGMLVVVYGIVRFARAYLATSRTFPRADVLLRWGLRIYLPLGALLTLVNLKWYVEDYGWFVDNIFAGLLMTVVIYISIRGYLRRLPAAGIFLLANALTFSLILATCLFHLVMSLNNSGYSPVRSLLPDLTVLAQTIGFSIALVARTRILQQELSAREKEVSQLELDLQEMALVHQVISQENQVIDGEIQHQRSRNEELQQKLEANQRELASITLYMAQKNEMLARLKTQLKEVKKQSPDNTTPKLEDIESLLQSNLRLDDEWPRFKLHFEQVHPGFFEDLKTKHPNLTKNEIRLCAYFHINLSTKEIAALLNIDPASVHRAKSRLSKKISI